MLFLRQNDYRLTNIPLYFVRSGHASVNSGHFWDMGNSGYFWSRTATPRHYSGETYSSAYDLWFNATGVGTSDGPVNRWAGRTLRGLGSGGGIRANGYSDRSTERCYLHRIPGNMHQV